jgi:hypothetical protein
MWMRLAAKHTHMTECVPNTRNLVTLYRMYILQILSET